MTFFIQQTANEVARIIGYESEADFKNSKPTRFKAMAFQNIVNNRIKLKKDFIKKGIIS